MCVDQLISSFVSKRRGLGAAYTLPRGGPPGALWDEVRERVTSDVVTGKLIRNFFLEQWVDILPDEQVWAPASTNTLTAADKEGPNNP